MVLANTNNYTDALDVIEGLQSQGETAKKAYPRILFGRAVELVNDRKYYRQMTS